MSAPVPHTCPIIDGVISEIKSATKNIDEVRLYFDDLTPSQIKELLFNAQGILEGLHGFPNSDIERIRDANEKLREWGDNTEKEVENLQDEISDLEYKLKNITA